MYTDHFSIANIPYGIASSTAHPSKSVVTRLEDTVIFLDKLAESRLLPGVPGEIITALSQPTTNHLASSPKAEQRKLRAQLQEVLRNEIPAGCKSDIKDVTMHLPIEIKGFTDFSCSRDHVLNASAAIRGQPSLPPGFLHFPIGYTGRASSIVISGTSITRPKGQFRDGQEVVYGPTRKLDYELEVGCVIGTSTVLGQTVSVNDADEHIFGLVLVNDWSARDIQGLEMAPLGPMNGKSFGTSMSPWIITLDALVPFETILPSRDFPVVSYLQDNKPKPTYDIQLQADLIVGDKSTTVCKSELRSMYWSLRDLVAQQTVNGCNINTGDVLATGTISGSTGDSHGCLLELTKGGAKSFALEGGDERSFLKDGDAVRLTAKACDGVGFGECIGTILPAK